MDVASLLSLIPLPPDVQRWIAFATVALTVLTALGKALDWLSPRLKAAADSMAIRAAATPGHLDDNAARGLASIARVAAQVAVIVGTVVDLLRAIVPRASVTIAGRSSSSPSSRPPSPPAVLSALVFVLLATVSIGCGGAPRAVRSGLAVTAETIVVVDRDVARRYTTAAEDALESAATLEEYRARMRRWDRVEASLRTSRMALLSAERAVDAWDESREGARAALGCLADALTMLAEALVEAGVPVPGKLLEVVSLGSAVLGTCGPAQGQEVSP